MPPKIVPRAARFEATLELEASGRRNHKVRQIRHVSSLRSSEAPPAELTHPLSKPVPEPIAVIKVDGYHFQSRIRAGRTFGALRYLLQQEPLEVRQDGRKGVMIDYCG